MEALTVKTAFTLATGLTLLSLAPWCSGLGVIDLTYQLKEGEAVGWYLYPPYNFTVLTRGHSSLINGWRAMTVDLNGRQYVAMIQGKLEFNKFATPEHRGTHVDAPAHFAKDHWRMQQVPPSRLVGPGVVIDVTEKVNGNSDYGITVQDLQDWEDRYGRIPNGAVILMRSGWGSRYPHANRVFQTEDLSNSSTYHFPGFTAEAALWLAQGRNIIALGGDTPSPDVAQNSAFPVHFILLERDILILENVANVDRLPADGTTIVLGALSIYDGSGSPLRILALTDLEECKCEGTNGAGRLRGPGDIAPAGLLAGLLLISMMMFY